MSFAIALYLAAKPITPAVTTGVILLVLLNGGVAASVMELGDTGLLIALLAALLATIVRDRPYAPFVTALLLGLAGWTPPEGLLIAAIIFAAGLILRVRHVFGSTRCVFAGFAGFLFGRAALTQGWPRPEAFAAMIPPICETHFGVLPFAGTLADTTRRFALVVRDALFNMPGTEIARLFVPILGGTLALIRLCTLGAPTYLGRHWPPCH